MAFRARSALVAVVASFLAMTAWGCGSAAETERASAAASTPDAAPPLAPCGPPPPPPLERPLRVLVGGDLLPHRPSLVTPAAIHAALAPLAPLFSKADAVVAN